MLTTLQLWTTYLQKNEVAFYGKRETDLPKFSFKYKLRLVYSLFLDVIYQWTELLYTIDRTSFFRDVRLVYNLPKKRRRRSKSSASSASGSGSFRTIRQEKRARKKEKVIWSTHFANAAHSVKNSFNFEILAIIGRCGVSRISKLAKKWYQFNWLQLFARIVDRAV